MFACFNILLHPFPIFQPILKKLKTLAEHCTFSFHISQMCTIYFGFIFHFCFLWPPSPGSASASSGSTMIGENMGVFIGGLPENFILLREDSGGFSPNFYIYLDLFSDYLMYNLGRCFKVSIF